MEKLVESDDHLSVGDEVKLAKKPKKVLAIYSSDEESSSNFEFKQNNDPKPIVCDSESEKIISPHLESLPKLPKFSLIKSTLLNSSDIESDSEVDSCENNSDKLESSHPVTHTESENNSLNCDSNKNEEHGVPVKDKKQRIKKTDVKLAILSETQRMEREMPVSLPYHKPKQRSLHEFLSRRKNQLNVDSLRLTSATMLKTWVEIDKSIQETASFFKSESEGEDDDNSAGEEELNYGKLKDSQSVNLDKPHNDDPQLTIECLGATMSTCHGNYREEKPNCSEDLKTLTDEATIPGVNCIHPQQPDHPIPNGEDDSCQALANLVDHVIKENNDNQINSQNPEIKDNNSLVELPSSSSKEKTGKWLDDIIAFDKRELLKKKLQLSSSILNKIPFLRNDKDAFIELENSQPSGLKQGARKLMERMLEGRQKRSHGPVTLTTTATELDDTGKIKNVTVDSMPLGHVPIDIVRTSKPGAKLQQLREKLRSEMDAKWEEEFKKREPVLQNKAGYEETIENVDDSTEENEESDHETESEPDEEDVVLEDKPKKFCAFVDSEAEESLEEGDIEGDDEESNADEDEKEVDDKESNSDENDKEGSDIKKDSDVDDGVDIDCSVLPAFQPGGGLLMGGSALTQQSQPLPIGVFSPSSSPAITLSENKKNFSDVGQLNEKPTGVKKNLFGSEQVTPGREGIFASQVDDADDPFLFVSGVFPDEKPSQEIMTPSQFKPKRLIVSQDSDESCGFENVLGEENSEPMLSITSEKKHSNRLSDHDDNELNSAKKKKKKLTFSDDEEENEDFNEDKAVDEEEEEVGESELNEEDIDYDSEENEVRPVRPVEFFENEAELSESEWSGDEDEQGLDRLEAEAGDADVLDEDQVASQLGRIHMRRLLDEDARDVRLLKELLFEDGDLHSDGKGRDRKFRWKNLVGFEAAGDLKGEEADALEEDDGDGHLAKLRYEKMQFLLQLEKDGKLQRIEEETQDGDTLLQQGRQLLQQLQSRSTTGLGIHKPSRARGSFLSKDNGFLSRLARATAGGNDVPLLGPANSKNFVFAAQEKEIVTEVVTVKEGMKRKALGCQDVVKRAKLMLTLNEQPSLLDQLHQSG